MIKLRIKNLSNKKKSFYLDIYFKGTRSYEFLNLYIESGATRAEIKRVTAIAEQIRTRKEETLLASYHGYTPNIANSLCFKDYFESIAKEKKLKNYFNALRHIRIFQTTPIPITSINSSWLNSFKNYLDSELSDNSVATYLGAVKAVLNRAVEDNLILKNPFNIKIKYYSREKVFLTLEELIKIKRVEGLTEKQYHCLMSFLFACFSGLRVSDLRKLKWDDIDVSNKRFSFMQEKTSSYEYMPLSPTCLGILENLRKRTDWRDIIMELPRKSDYVFPFVSSITTQTYSFHLRAICKKAGVQKHVTSHSARHTYATLSLTSGTDLYTVSKLMGHSDIQVTQVYAKIIDSKKIDAVNNLPDIWK